MDLEKTKREMLAKLFKWSKRKYRDAHLNRFHNDIKCPKCNEWFSISGIEYKHTYISPAPDFGYAVRCGQCDHKSYWNCVAFPFPARCNEHGTPIN